MRNFNSFTIEGAKSLLSIRFLNSIEPCETLKNAFLRARVKPKFSTIL